MRKSIRFYRSKDSLQKVQVMNRKEGIIENRLTHKPSFKNLVNIEQAQVPSRSKSKSANKRKASEVPNKSPRRVLNRPSSHATDDAASEFSHSYDQANYTDVKSEISIRSGSKSPKKSKKDHDIMKKIILCKNKVVETESAINDLEARARESHKARSSGKRLETPSAYIAEIKKLKDTSTYLDDYLDKLRSSSEALAKEYQARVEQLSRETNPGLQMDATVRKPQKIYPGMPDLQRKLAAVASLLQ